MVVNPCLNSGKTCSLSSFELIASSTQMKQWHLSAQGSMHNGHVDFRHWGFARPKQCIVCLKAGPHAYGKVLVVRGPCSHAAFCKALFSYMCSTRWIGFIVSLNQEQANVAPRARQGVNVSCSLDREWRLQGVSQTFAWCMALSAHPFVQILCCHVILSVKMW